MKISILRAILDDFSRWRRSVANWTGRQRERRGIVEWNDEHLYNANEQTPQLKQSLRHLSDAPSRVFQLPPSPTGAANHPRCRPR